MTPSQILKKVNDIKPCVLDNKVLLSFISIVEAKLRLIINNDAEFTTLKYENIDTDKLTLSEEYSKVYLYYVSSQIDLYSNNNAMDEYMKYVKSRKQTTPKKQYNYKGAFS